MKARRKQFRKGFGFSMLEILVSLVVMGVAIAGLTEMLWFNLSWSNKLQNRFENYYAVSRFSNHLRKLVAEASAIQLYQNGTALQLRLPVFFDAGTLKTSSIVHQRSVSFVVKEETTPGRYYLEDQDGKIWVRGIVGPLQSGKTGPQIFRFVNSDPSSLELNFGTTEQPSIRSNMVAVNLELQRQDFGTKQGVSNANLVFHAEYFLRNGRLHGQ